MPECIILSGIPCSGKSTITRNYPKYKVLSCDLIRYEFFGDKYTWKKEREDEVWSTFYNRLALIDQDCIIDNTNCKLGYINKIKGQLREDFKIKVIRVETSLVSAYYRNIMRYLRTGKWIPFKVISDMKRNYNNLWKGQEIFGLQQTPIITIRT